MSVTALYHRMSFRLQGDLGSQSLCAEVWIEMATRGYTFPQVLLTFAPRLRHPFVSLLRVGGDGWPQDYVALAPVTDEHVYILQQWSPFAVEPATHLLLDVDSEGHLQTQVQQEGRERMFVRVTVGGQRVWNKISASKIRLQHTCGETKDPVEFLHGGECCIWRAANVQLARWAETVPDDGNYHEIDFRVEYGEGAEPYEGTYALRARDVRYANLGRHIWRFCEWYGGRRPRRLTLAPHDPAYSQSSTLGCLRDYQTLIRQLGDKVDRCASFLQDYEVRDDPAAVEPPSSGW
jgi:hypothetical protein